MDIYESIRPVEMMGIHKRKNTDTVVFYNHLCGAIAEYTFRDNKLNIIWLADRDVFLQKNQYGGVAEYNGNLVFAPRSARRILIFQQQNKTARYIDFDYLRYSEAVTWNRFVGVEVHGEYAYFFPGTFPAIMKLDMSDGNIEYIDEWSNEFGEMPDRSKVIFANRKRDGDKVILPCWQRGLILAFDLNNDSWEIIYTGDDGIADIATDLDCYWGSFLSCGNNLIRVQKDTKEIEEISIKRPNEHQYGYRYIFADGDWLYCIPYKGSAVVRINKSSFEVEEIQDREKSSVPNSEEEFSPYCAIKQDDTILMYDVQSKSLVEIINEHIYRHNVRWDNGMWEMLRIKTRHSTGNIVYETEHTGLVGFCRAIRRKQVNV